MHLLAFQEFARGCLNYDVSLAWRFILAGGSGFPVRTGSCIRRAGSKKKNQRHDQPFLHSVTSIHSVSKMFSLCSMP
jgi:hypothetical protein